MQQYLCDITITTLHCPNKSEIYRPTSASLYLGDSTSHHDHRNHSILSRHHIWTSHRPHNSRIHAATAHSYSDDTPPRVLPT